MTDLIDCAINHEQQRLRRIRLKYLFGIVFCLAVSHVSLLARTLQSDLQSDAADYYDYEGLVVDSVIIDNRNIFDTSDEEYDKLLFRLANSLHIKTTKRAIAREVLLEKGSIFSNELAEETSRILRERFILYDAWVEKELLENGNVLVRVVTIDQWSLSIGTDLRREGNENTVKIGALERNLFGNNQLVSFHYIHQTEDDNYVESSFSDYRLIGYPIRAAIQYSNNPKSSFTAFSVGRPFYNLGQRFGFSLNYYDVQGRSDIYENDVIASVYKYRGDKTSTEFSYRFGAYRKKLITKLGYNYNYESLFDTVTYLTDHSVDYYPDDSLSHTFQSTIQLANYQFAKRKNIDGFSYTEDFTLGQIVDFTFEKIYNADLTGSLYNTFSFGFINSFLVKKNLFFMKAQVRYSFKDGLDLRKRWFFNLKYYNSSLPYMTLAFHSQYIYDYSGTSSKDLLILGGTTGLRGYNKYFKTGDKLLIVNTELRFHPRIALLSVLVGGTLFADFGQMRESGTPLRLSDGYYSSVGAGLRIAFEKSSKKVIRVDVSYSRQYKLTLSIGTGMYFSAGNSI